MIQKKRPKVIAAPSSPLLASVVGAEIGGIIANIRNAKNRDTTNNGTHAIPKSTGPKGVIQS